jgi:cyclase
MKTFPYAARRAVMALTLGVTVLFTSQATAQPPVPDFSSATDPYHLEWQSPAEGVWIGVRPASARIPVVGTTVIVAGADSMLVFDGGGAPLQAERVVEKIRSVSDLPVSHIVISHWHGDHHLGLSPLRAAWPGAQLIAHEFTREALASALMDNVRDAAAAEPGALAAQIEGILARGDAGEGPAAEPATRAWLEQALAHAALIEEQARAARIPDIDVTLTTRMDIDLGGRPVELHHLGHGNTKGDVMLYIPDARIMAAGDSVVHPTPYGFFSYPRAWAQSLRKLRAFDVALLVPGHGTPQTDWAYVDLLIETLDRVADQVAALVAEGHDLDAVRERMDWSAVEARFTAGDPFWAGRFAAWFKTPIIEAAYRLETGLDNEELAPPATAHDHNGVE